MMWQLELPGQFYDCNEDRLVYFDPASGDTHLISVFAAYLIGVIAAQRTPLSTEEILALVAPDISEADFPEINTAIPEILGELATLDIIATT